MATRKARRGRKRGVRPLRGRRTPPATPGQQLIDIIAGLRLAMAAVMVSVEALRRQNAELDEEIALVLERNASDRIDSEIDKLETLAAHPRLA